MSQSQVSYIIIYATKKKMLKITMARTVLLYGITNLPLFQYQYVCGHSSSSLISATSVPPNLHISIFMRKTIMSYLVKCLAEVFMWASCFLVPRYHQLEYVSAYVSHP